MADIDLTLLTALLTPNDSKVQFAMDRVHDGTGAVMPLKFIFETNAAKSPAEAILDYLSAVDKIPAFVGALRALGEEIVALKDPANQIAAIVAQGINPIEFAAFLTASRAFRCRIKVNDVVMGSGVLVSYRFVLTAWHVINRAQAWDANDPPRIEILTSDGQTLPARPAEPSSPCHPQEWQGVLPKDTALAGHDDFTLLRLAQPVGLALGFIKPTCPPVQWKGKISCFLVHYPTGADAGVTQGEAIFGDTARRYRHTAISASGSSGGAIFSNKCELLGIHQKAYVGEDRLFVPTRNFANDDTAPFVSVLRGDQTPTYLWSMDGSLTENSQLIIGRRVFFEALDHMLDPTTTGGKRLRGIWIRRKRADEDQSGMSFGFDLLKAFLARRQPEARLERVGLRSTETDLLTLLQTTFGIGLTPNLAGPGVRADETTSIAFDSDRAKSVVQQIEQSTEGPIWLYIDGPKDELGDLALQHLEQFLTHLFLSAQIRIVLTRMESHALPLNRFDSLAETSGIGPPGVIYEYSGDFSLEDVMTTIRAVSHDLDLQLSNDVVRFIADNAVNGIATTHGLYSATEQRAVGERLLGLLSSRVAAL